MKNSLYFILFLFIVKSTYAETNLEFQKISFSRDDVELSALYKKGENFLFVADKLSNRSIYKVIFEKNRFYSKELIDLSKLKGHNLYFAKALFLKHAGHIINSPFDLEGLTSCKEDYYLVNERVRHILKISKNNIKRLNIDFSPAFKAEGHPLEKISRNAGFEGIAADCENQRLYIAQERSPRGIITYNFKTNKVESTFLFENKNTEWGSSDFADLHYENGFLYLLERNEHKISKYDLKKKKIVSSVKFGDLKGIHLRQLYKTGETYGLSEGLTMTKDQIVIGIDNNKNKISQKGQKVFKLKGNYSSIIFYKRPKNF